VIPQRARPAAIPRGATASTSSRPPPIAVTPACRLATRSRSGTRARSSRRTIRAGRFPTAPAPSTSRTRYPWRRSACHCGTVVIAWLPPPDSVAAADAP